MLFILIGNRIFYLSMIFLSAFFIAIHLGSSLQPWFLVTVFSFALLPTEVSIKKRLKLILVCAFFYLLGLNILSLLAYSLVLCLCFTIFWLFAMNYFLRRYAEYFFAFVLAVLLSFCLFQKYQSPTDFYTRNGFIMLGILWVMSAQLFLLPLTKRGQELIHTFFLWRTLRNFTEDIFNCFLENYSEYSYVYERRLYKVKRQVMQLLIKANNTETAEENRKEQKIYFLLISLSQLRYEVKAEELNHCRSELLAIKKALLTLFNDAKNLSFFNASRKIPAWHFKMLEIAVKQLEENYQQVLTVTVENPSVFLIFIARLKELMAML